MKIVICSPTGHTDYTHFRRYADKFVETCQRLSIEVVALAYSQPDFLAKVGAFAADADTAIYFTFYCFDEALIPSARLPMAVLDIVRGARARILATVGDHPFTAFQQTGFLFADPKISFLVIEPTFVDEAKLINPKLSASVFRAYTHFPSINFDGPSPVDFEDRVIDVLVPMRTTSNDISIQNLRDLADSGAIAQVVEATYQEALVDVTRNPLQIFAERCLEVSDINLADVRESSPDNFRFLLSLISMVDDNVRQARRGKMLAALLRSIGNLNVVVTNPPPSSVDIDPRIKFVGRIPGDTYVELLKNSKAVVNCSPSYPNRIHERITDAMLYGCCAITDLNPAISAFFSPHEFIPHTAGSDATLADIFASHDIGAVADAGRRRICDDPQFSWEEHIAQIKSVAATRPETKRWWQIF